MGAILAIVGKDLRLRLRDRSLLIYGLLAPFIISAVLGFVFGGLDESVTVRIAIAGTPGSPVYDALVDDVLPALGTDGLVDDLAVVSDREALLALVEAGDAGAGLHIAPDDGQQAGAVEVIASSERPLSASIVQAIAEQVTARTSVIDAAVEAGVAVGGAPDAIAAAAAAAGPSIEVVARGVGTVPLDSTTYVAGGIAVFFLFFAVGIAVTSMLDEERDGTLDRLRTAPISPVAVIAAKGVMAMLVGVTSLAVLAAGTTVALGASWGPPTLLAALFVAAVLAAVGLVGLIASVAPTPESATSLQGVAGTVMGALGGSFFPIAAGGLLGSVALLTPHHWFLDGLRLVAGGADLRALLPTLAVLSGMGIVMCVGAAVLFRRRLGL